MNLNRNPIYLTGKTRRAARRNSLLNSGTVLFVAFVIFINYDIFTFLFIGFWRYALLVSFTKCSKSKSFFDWS